MLDMRCWDAGLNFSPSTADIAANVLSPKIREDGFVPLFFRFSTIASSYHKIGRTRKRDRLVQIAAARAGRVGVTLRGDVCLTANQTKLAERRRA
jgi:hypothetical protein